MIALAAQAARETMKFAGRACEGDGISIFRTPVTGSMVPPA